MRCESRRTPKDFAVKTGFLTPLEPIPAIPPAYAAGRMVDSRRDNDRVGEAVSGVL